ncbi:LysM peptidoglycan-binding domain-containing protein [Opitutus terrae]|uniref:Uncharacterized protein n=1 Tax=Opitutus terrae (strain DSM 11246 / JCM 15787 / PB90-1) TaxID=452637 RepID=B1ZQD4_OPITP|nr:LysM peptidoglycan-binding domain-containing protein [Opitutus terrae]ACB73614.1 hypothetical protein Oter_0324 [Opitutus terrae PB90-1]
MKTTTITRRGSGWLGVLLGAAAFAAGPATGAPTKADRANISGALLPEGGHIVIEAQGVPPEPRLFFSASADHVIRLTDSEVTGEVQLRLQVVQGRPDVLSLGLSGDGEIVDVAGAGLRDWAVRTAVVAETGRNRAEPANRRFLDVHPALAAPRDLRLVVHTRLRKPPVPGTSRVLLVTPGEAVGFASNVRLEPDSSVDLRVTSAVGVVSVGESGAAHGPQLFSSTGDGSIEVRLTPRGSALAPAEMVGAQIAGRVNEPTRSVEFRLRGQLRVQKAGVRLRMLAGMAALADKVAGDGWHVELARDDEHFWYELVGDREGAWPVDLGFTAAVTETGDWRKLAFQMPAGAVVPLRLEGLPDGVEFQEDAEVVPSATAGGWQGFLPASGVADVAWKHARKAAEGVLAFTSLEQTEVRVGAGLLRQESQVTLRVLQGKLADVQLRLDGPGEILGVMGENVVGWNVRPSDESSRLLEVRLSRPLEGEGTLVVRSQSALGPFPVRAEPVRLTPTGTVRHSGFVRIANNGAVRLEVVDATGMMQLAPTQFPGAGVEEGARQVFVYRFPAASYGYRVVANQVQAEVSVSQLVTYELTDTDRVINAELELDVREAPLREWSLLIPDGYAVVSIAGNEVTDHALESEAHDGQRKLKVLFARAVEGRQLLQLRLEKNQPAGAGEWRLPPLRFPDAKSVRGHVGAVAVPGYRMVPLGTEQLAEVPLSFFPRQRPGLQQAWRLREPEWAATVRLEQLGQSVQTDVFHLYSLKEGVVYGSVLFNYFVIGAPAAEWRIEVPESVGNLEIVGQDVRRDWRREGNEVIVTLHQPVLGAATLLVTFEQPMSARGGVIRPGELRPIGVQSERGFVQVVSPLQIKHTVTRADGGLLKLEPLELPAEFRLLTSSPSLAVYQYTARPFALEMNVEWYAPAETVEQVVDYAKLASQISREGEVVTEARFFVKTRGRQALRVGLPAGVRLWEVRVDREVVTARSDGDRIVVPLPARANPSIPVEVALRLGQPANAGSRVRLVAPSLGVPVIIDEWTVRGDAERLLVPESSNVALEQPVLTESGFEWIAARGRKAVGVLLALVALGGLLLRGTETPRLASGVATCAIATVLALFLALHALADRRPNLVELSYATTMMPTSEAVMVQLANVAPWRAMLSGWGVVALVVGLVAAAVGRWRRRAVVTVAGVVIFAGGVLAQRLGAPVFFAMLAVGLVLMFVMPGSMRLLRAWQAGRTQSAATAGTATVALLLLLLSGAGFGAAPSARAQEVPASLEASESRTPAAQSIVQTWSIREQRLFAELDVTVRGAAGDSFVLLHPPAVMTEFRGEALRVNKVTRGDEDVYLIVLDRDGTWSAHARFEMALAGEARAVAVPTGPAALQRITVDLDQPGWEFASAHAVQVMPAAGLAENHSGATLTLTPGTEAEIQLQPRQRDLATEATQFFAEVANLYLPAPGVVNGVVRVTVRPAQGRVREVELSVPAGFTVGDVTGGPLGAWRFDPASRRLRVAIEPVQTAAFSFQLEMQLGTGALPQELGLEPVRVLGAAGEVGMLALGFGGDAQPEGVRSEGLSAINLEDFDATLVPRDRDGQPLATVQQAWRYGQDAGRIALRVAPVAAEIRVTSRQLFTLDDDRLVAALDLNVAITRVGLFRLSFALPAGLEVEALSGPALNHWTETTEANQRIVTLHLNGRTMGEQRFNLSLAGAAPAAQEAWPVPHVQLREATRHTGELLLVPGKGIRLRAVDRDNATQLDPRSIGGVQPGTLAFRLLQEDWALRVGIETLEPWVTVQALQEVTVREGQTLTRIAARYRIENAALKHLRVRLPGLSADQVRTVRGSGAAVSDFVKVAGESDTWDVVFQRGMAGETDVQIEFQGVAGNDEARATIPTPVFSAARQSTLFVAVRSGGRVELEATELPRGWQRTDWSAVPGELQNPSDRTVPVLCYRVAEPEGALGLAVRRHDVAQALKLRVTGGQLTTLFSPEGASLTAVELNMDVVEKSTLRIKLPTQARLFNTFVNAESVSVVREGDECLFHVFPNSAADHSATVRLVYSTPGQTARRIALTGPSLSVPLENVRWRIVLPPGYRMEDYAGNLRLRESRAAGLFGIDQYQALVSSTHSAEARKAAELFEQASGLVQRGEQQQAAEVLSRAAKNSALDQAANEDARVQLRELKTQQAVLGLNTRRQRLYLDNRADSARNEQLEQAANLNPFMQGRVNFDPQQVEQMLMGNTVEENTALRGIAARLVEQQLAAEPAPAAIDVTLPERGRVLTFTRSLQVDGAAPLTLRLELGRLHRLSVVFTLVLLAGLGVVTALILPRRSGSAQG